MTATAWLVAALALGIAELVVPGVFLIFLAIAAGITAAIALAVPDAPVVAQVAAFAAWSTAAVLIGRRWYRDYPVPSSDVRLNDRAARMIGETVTIERAISGGTGRALVGDGAWPATGPDMPEGALARIVTVQAGVLVVEPLATLPNSAPS